MIKEPGYGLWRMAIKNLVKDGTITVEQANECYRRLRIVFENEQSKKIRWAK